MEFSSLQPFSMIHWILIACKALCAKYCMLSFVEGYEKSIIKAFMYTFQVKEILSHTSSHVTLTTSYEEYRCDCFSLRDMIV